MKSLEERIGSLEGLKKLRAINVRKPPLQI